MQGTGTEIGGLVGSNNGLIQTSQSSGFVTGGSIVGGLVGFNVAAVDDSTSFAQVEGDASVGGVAGQNSGVLQGTGEGFAQGTSEVGGVVGQNNAGVDDIFFFGVDYGTRGSVFGAGFEDVTGTTNVGGVVGLNTGAVANSESQADVTGQTSVGGLVGSNSGSVTTSSASGTITGGAGSTGVGGLVGLNTGSVTTSFATGPVSGAADVGGLVGQNQGPVNTTYALGNVSGTTNVGGLVGENDYQINNSFAMGVVTGTTDVGGLVGFEGPTPGPTPSTSIDDSYSTGAVFGTTGAGGLVGATNGADTVTNAYWDTLTSGLAASARGVGHTTAELQGAITFPLGAAFAGGAAGGETDVYPYLLSFFPTGVQAISGFAYKDADGAVPLASTATGAAQVTAVFHGTADGTLSASTGANGYYYVFGAAGSLPAASNIVSYTVANATTGATDAATYLAGAGANNTTATLFGATFSETTALPTYTGLVAAVASATHGDAGAATAIGGVSFINIAATGADFRIDQPISTPADLTISGTNTTIAANVTATGGVSFFTPVTLAGTATIDSGSAGALFSGAVDGSAAPGVGLTVNGPAALFGNVTTANGAIAFNGPVILHTNATISSGTATTTFGATIDSGTTEGVPQVYDLTATAGAFSFGGAMGSTLPLGAVSLTSTASMTLPSISAASILAHTTSAGASITLAPGTVLTASGDGTAVTLAATGAFINNSGEGTGAIVLTGDPPNWLIYADSPADSVFGGLNSNNQAIWNTTYPAAAPPTTGNFYLFAFQPTVTFTSINDSKGYTTDATAKVATDFAVSGINPGVAGAYLPDTPATAYSGAPSVTSTGSPANATVAGGPYAINVAQGSLAGLNGYALAFASPGLLTVTPEAITVSAAANTKTYDSTTSAGATPTVTTGTLLDGATLAETYATPNAGTGIALNPTIAFTDPTAASNYTVTLAPAATGVINPEPIVITATTNTKVYDGANSAAALPTISSPAAPPTGPYTPPVRPVVGAGVIYDASTLSETYATSNAGNGLTLNPAVAFASPAAANNYAITYVPVTTGVITPEPITITATPNTKFFDGTNSAAATPALTNGTLFDPATLSETYATINPAQGIVLNPAIAFAVPAAANNYTITLVPTGETPPDTGVILPLNTLVNLSPSVFVNPPPNVEIPGANSACGVDLRLPQANDFADPVAAVQAISAAAAQYVEHCRDASQEDIANALDNYADALQVIIQKLPPKLRAQLQHLPALVHAAAARARVAPTRIAAVRVLRQTIAEVHREISLVRAEDPDSARIRSAVNTGVTGVLNSASLALARAEGI